MAQGILSRFYDKDAEKVVFQEKGSHSFGIAGAYRSFAVFGEARLYANFGATKSCPTDLIGVQLIDKMRTTNTFSTGLKIAGGLCVRLRGSNALTISVPLVGAAYTNTRQHKAQTNNNAHLSDFKIARNLDILGLQVAYCHFIGPKNKKK